MDAKRIVLGVCGGIAAYKSAFLLRLLTKAGHDVTVVPTANALQMVGKATWEALSGKPVHTDVFEAKGEVEHIELARSADLVLVAPATADFLARYRMGRADDMLGAVLLATTAPVVLAPAMHTQMWLHPATVENVQVLRQRGVHIIEPAVGALTSGDSGAGRLPEPEVIADLALGFLTEPSLAGRRILISGGGTHEAIDPVRFIGNLSSGRQACEIAREARNRGAEVTLVGANIDRAIIPSGVGYIAADSASEMLKEMTDRQGEADAIVMCAAVADYRPRQVCDSKIDKTSNPELVLQLEGTTDVLRQLVQNKRPGQVVVGFAAHTGTTEQVIAAGTAKAIRKGADLLAINRVGQGSGFGDVTNELFIVDKTGNQVGHGEGSKRDCAAALLDLIHSQLVGDRD